MKENEVAQSHKRRISEHIVGEALRIVGLLIAVALLLGPIIGLVALGLTGHIDADHVNLTHYGP